MDTLDCNNSQQRGIAEDRPQGSWPQHHISSSQSRHLLVRNVKHKQKRIPHRIIYIYAFSRRFYPKRLTEHSGYTFLLSVSVFPGNGTHDLCTANAMLYHWATNPLETHWEFFVINIHVFHHHSKTYDSITWLNLLTLCCLKSMQNTLAHSLPCLLFLVHQSYF